MLVLDSATSVEDEKRQIAELATGLIERVDFGRDFQLMLSFYGDARAAFSNLDPVLAFLVQVKRRTSFWRSSVDIHSLKT